MIEKPDRKRITKCGWMKPKKKSIRKGEKNQASSGKPFKLGLIFQTLNPLNYKPELN
jgi:hypothetical protein